MGFRDPIVQERVLSARPEDVFAAWGDAESLRVWMCPSDDMSAASAEVDFRVGGAFKIVMHGQERNYGHTGEYLEIDAPRRLVFTWVSDFVPPDEAKTKVTVTMEPQGEAQTKIVLVHEELPDTGTYDGHENGWATILRLLGEHLEK